MISVGVLHFSAWKTGDHFGYGPAGSFGSPCRKSASNCADVRRVVEARPVGDDGERNRSGEAIGLRHRPRRHEAAVAAAGDRDARVVGDPVAHERVDARRGCPSGRRRPCRRGSRARTPGRGRSSRAGSAGTRRSPLDASSSSRRSRESSRTRFPSARRARRRRAAARRSRGPYGSASSPSISRPSNDSHVVRRQSAPRRCGASSVVERRERGAAPSSNRARPRAGSVGVSYTAKTRCRRRSGTSPPGSAGR